MVIRVRQLKDRQHNGQMKKIKRTHNSLSHIILRIEFQLEHLMMAHLSDIMVSLLVS